VKARIKMAPNPFAFGAERVAYYGIDVTCQTKPTEIVLKRYTGGPRGFLNSSVHYESAIHLQAIAAFLADKFNKELMEKV
jgi:hypothetical protein